MSFEHLAYTWQGDDVALSYLDAAQLALPCEGRRAALAHYAFECGCARCAAEEATATDSGQPQQQLVV